MGEVVTLDGWPAVKAGEPTPPWRLQLPRAGVLAAFRLGMLRAAHGRPERPIDSATVKRGHRMAVWLMRQPLIDWQPATPPLLRRIRRQY